MVIKSLYGMKLELDKDALKKYKAKRDKAIELLGDKYRLANPIRREMVK
mgnify:CR=1 FL=1